MKTIKQTLSEAVNLLETAGVENSSNEARWMLQELCGVSNNRIYFDGNTELSDSSYNLFFEAVHERLNGRPLQYILQTAYFMGRDFHVGEGVLIPRPETEMLVDFVTDYLNGRKDSVCLDLCTGSGCIGLSCALSCPENNFYLVDVSKQALEYTCTNKNELNVSNAVIVEGDILNGFNFFRIPSFDVLVSNPPYIRSDELPDLQQEVLSEPALALDGGTDGLIFYRAIAEKWLPFSNKGAFVALECGEDQTDCVASILADYCTDISIHNDFNCLPRCVTAVVKGN